MENSIVVMVTSLVVGHIVNKGVTVWVTPYGSVPKLRQVLFVRLQQVIKHCLYPVCFGTQRVDKQGLISRFAVSMHCRFHGQYFVGFDRSNKPELRLWQ